ncbi:MAG: PQQ-binding-like beta-propeller repeat protein [Pirellulales bacterium]
MSESIRPELNRQNQFEVASPPGQPRESRPHTARENDDPPAKESTPTVRRRWPKGLFALAVFLLLCVAIARWTAAEFDHAVVNIITLIGVFFAWLSVTGATYGSPTARWIWKTLLFLPIAGLLFASLLLRWERVDSELVPQLKWRWTPKPELVSSTPGLGSSEISFAQAQSDFSQFLGPDRNGIIPGTRLDPDWINHPPQILWKHPIGEGWSGFAVRGSVAITMEQRELEQWVSAYHVATGELIWHAVVPGRHKNPLGGTGPRSTPTIHGDRVYANLATGELLCLNLNDGTVVWQQNLLDLVDTDFVSTESEVSWGRSASPLIVGETVIVPIGGVGSNVKTLGAFQLADGSPVWAAGSEQISYGSPMLAVLKGTRQILYISTKSLTAYRPEDGMELWHYDWPGKSSADANVSQPIPLNDSRVLLSKGYGRGAAVIELSIVDEQWKAEEIWSVEKVLKTKFTNCVVKDGYAYGLSDGILECVDTATGKSAWKKGRYRHGQLLLVGDKLLISSESGQAVLVDADPTKYREAAKLDVIGDVTWNPPTLSGDMLLMRNSNEAACVKLSLLPAGDAPNVDARDTVPAN